MTASTARIAVVLTTVLIAAVAASRFHGGDWLAAIVVPGWSPSALVFAEGWTTWYAAWSAMAVAMAGRPHTPPSLAGMGVWLCGLAGVVAWHACLMGRHRPGLALGVMTLLFAVGVFALLRGGRWHRYVPLPAAIALAWLAFMWCWNVAVWRSGGGGLASVLG